MLLECLLQYAKRHVCNTILAELLRFLTYEFKDCNNGQDKEKEEIPMTAEMVYYKAAETG